MAYDIGPRIGIDGESEFRKQLNNINTSLKTLGTELDKVSSDFGANAKSEQALISKNQVLQKSIDAQKKKIEEVSYALQEAREKFGENSTEALKWQQVLNRSETNLNNLEAELKANDKALDEMAQGLRDTETGLEKVDSASSGLDKLGENLKGATITAAKALTAAVVGLGTALVGAAESSREYRTNMGKLDTAFNTNGHSAEAAKNTYKELVGVLGESDQSVEAANHLAVLTDNEKDLQTWTDICTGVFATFGDSLPIEGLTEAANETAKVGKVTGPLADALNWAGISEDEFNQKLAQCSDEQERQQLIMDTLNGVYKDAAKEYKNTNKEVIAANKAQDNLRDAIARVGAVIEPFITTFKNFAASLINGFANILEKVRELPKGVQAIIFGFVGLIAAAGPAILAFNALSENMKKIKGTISDVGKLFGKKTIATTTDTAATAANTAATTANTTATNLLTKAKSALSKALAVGKWVALGAAVVGAGVLLYQFAKDSDAASAMVEGFTDKAVSMVGKFAGMIPQVVQALGTMLPTIINAGGEILLALMQGIAQAIPQIAEAIPQIINAILTALVDNIDLLLTAGIQIITGLLNGIVQAIPQIMLMVPQILMAIVNSIISNLSLIISSAIQIILALVQGIVQALPQLIAALPQIINAIVTGITQNLPMIINGAIQIIVALIQGLIQAIPQLIAAIPQIISAIVSGLLSMLGQIFTVGVQILKKLWSGISSWVGSLSSKVVSFAKSLPGKIKSGIGSLISVGGDWVKGLWNGISDKVGWITSKIKGFGKSCLNAIKDFFGINSPSVVMKNEVGRNMAEGVGVGFVSQMKRVKNTIDDSLRGVLTSTEKVAASGKNPVSMGIDYSKFQNEAQAIYIDGRLIGRALKRPLLNQGVVIS